MVSSITLPSIKEHMICLRILKNEFQFKKKAFLFLFFSRKAGGLHFIELRRKKHTYKEKGKKKEHNYSICSFKTNHNVVKFVLTSSISFLNKMNEPNYSICLIVFVKFSHISRFKTLKFCQMICPKNI